MEPNPTLDLLQRVDAAQQFMADVMTPIAWLAALLVAYIVWNTIRRRDP